MDIVSLTAYAEKAEEKVSDWAKEEVNQAKSLNLANFKII